MARRYYYPEHAYTWEDIVIDAFVIPSMSICGRDMDVQCGRDIVVTLFAPSTCICGRDMVIGAFVRVCTV